MCFIFSIVSINFISMHYEVCTGYASLFIYSLYHFFIQFIDLFRIQLHMQFLKIRSVHSSLNFMNPRWSDGGGEWLRTPVEGGGEGVKTPGFTPRGEKCMTSTHFSPIYFYRTYLPRIFTP